MLRVIDLVAASALKTVFAARGGPFVIGDLDLNHLPIVRCVWQQRLLARPDSAHLFRIDDVLFIRNTNGTITSFNWRKRALLLRCPHPVFQAHCLGLLL